MTTVAPAVGRSDISAIAYGFMASKALFAALEIGVFTILAAGPLAPVDLADRAGLAVGRLRTLLHALTGLGLVVRDGDTFGNAAAADRYLVRDRPDDFGDYFRLQLGRQIYPALLHLGAGIAGTGRAFDTMSALLSAPESARTFTTAQHLGSLAAARVLADRLLPDRLPAGLIRHRSHPASRRRRRQRSLLDRALPEVPDAAGHRPRSPDSGGGRPRLPGRGRHAGPDRVDRGRRRRHAVTGRTLRRPHVLPAQRPQRRETRQRGRGRTGQGPRLARTGRPARRARLHARRRRGRSRCGGTVVPAVPGLSAGRHLVLGRRAVRPAAPGRLRPPSAPPASRSAPGC
jgi:Dimerisation domain